MFASSKSIISSKFFIIDCEDKGKKEFLFVNLYLFLS